MTFMRNFCKEGSGGKQGKTHGFFVEALSRIAPRSCRIDLRRPVVKWSGWVTLHVCVCRDMTHVWIGRVMSHM